MISKQRDLFQNMPENGSGQPAVPVPFEHKPGEQQKQGQASRQPELQPTGQAKKSITSPPEMIRGVGQGQKSKCLAGKIVQSAEEKPEWGPAGHSLQVGEHLPEGLVLKDQDQAGEQRDEQSGQGKPGQKTAQPAWFARRPPHHPVSTLTIHSPWSPVSTESSGRSC